jgi:regulator of protease activity HflC (stomatin/prohibitin superfamily)
MNVPWKLVIFITVMVLVLGTAGGMYGCPKYKVWQQQLHGEAELKRAESNRRIKVYEAQALKDSAKLQAEAEVERAKGVAEANRIVADGLKGHDEYLRYLWIDKVANQPGREVIYVPTEAALPILESTRLSKPFVETPR